jgi:hypothetical protein
MMLRFHYRQKEDNGKKQTAACRKGILRISCAVHYRDVPKRQITRLRFRCRRVILSFRVPAIRPGAILADCVRLQASGLFQRQTIFLRTAPMLTHIEMMPAARMTYMISDGTESVTFAPEAAAM